MTAMIQIVLLILLVVGLLCLLCAYFRIKRIVKTLANENRTVEELSPMLSPLLRRVTIYIVFLTVISVAAFVFKLIG